MEVKDLPKCGVEIALRFLNTKWKFLIIRDLLEGTKRFGELKKSLKPITQKVLTTNLRDMEEMELVERKVYSQVPPKVEYTLTDVGYSLAGILDAMADWGSSYKKYLKLVSKTRNED